MAGYRLVPPAVEKRAAVRLHCQRAYWLLADWAALRALRDTMPLIRHYVIGKRDDSDERVTEAETGHVARLVRFSGSFPRSMYEERHS